MLRNVITGPKTVEIYKVASDMSRGAIVTKNFTTKVADKASDVAVETYLVDYDSQPMGHLSDVEISAYETTMDTVKANSYAVLIKPSVGSQWAIDQIVSAGLKEGDYLVAGTAANAGKLVKATAGKVSTYKYVGPYIDGDKTLHQFEVVYPYTLA
ncbi:hypothetical protein [Brevibacillus sp. NRS-1366]|uniref:hypothetical protein n=1 Tax=Brevibacillus sp. NRS-1366 TaxID=3233899 RepID=UPI003D248734